MCCAVPLYSRIETVLRTSFMAFQAMHITVTRERLMTMPPPKVSLREAVDEASDAREDLVQMLRANANKSGIGSHQAAAFLVHLGEVV